MASNNGLFVNNYKEILDVRPRYGVQDIDKNDCLNDGILCVACSPLITLVWSFCCMGVTCKKMYKNCNSVCVKTEILDPDGQTYQTDTTTTTIKDQPQREPVIPKEIKKNPRLK